MKASDLARAKRDSLAENPKAKTKARVTRLPRSIGAMWAPVGNSYKTVSARPQNQAHYGIKR